MNKTIYIHVGAGKTGTTALQNFFCLNEEVLANRYSILYPKEGRIGENHLLLDYAFARTHPNLFVEKTVNQNLEDLKILANTSEHKNFLISSEYFLGLTFEETLLLKNYLSGFQIKIIVYFREQAAFLESWYNQMVKSLYYHGSIYQLKETLEASNVLNYTKYIETFSNIFGEQNIIVRPYETTQFIGGNIFSDFLNILGIKTLDKFNLPSKRKNESISRETIDLFRIINKLAINKNKKNKIKRALHSLLHTKNLNKNYKILSDEDRLEIKNTYRESNALMAKRYLNRDDGIFFYEESLSTNFCQYKPLTKIQIIELFCDIFPN